MNSYELKQEARRERLLARADKLRAAALRLSQQASEQAAMIPLGQPILIGHHSERRDRNFRNRISRAFEKASQLEQQARTAAARADGVGRSGVSSDDPDAVAKLQDQLGALQLLQERMKAANRALRRGDDAALRAQGFSDAQIAKLKLPDSCGRTGFPDYALQNNGANVRRIKQRIEELSKRPTQDTEREIKCVRVIESAGENRMCLVFPGKPDERVRKILRAHGFVWSPSRVAWVRKLNNAARYGAQCVLDSLPPG
jgi:hypothetical protein